MSAGTSIGLLYYYFGSKAVLISESVEWLMSRLVSQVRSQLATASGERRCAALAHAMLSSEFGTEPVQRLYIETIGLGARNSQFGCLSAGLSSGVHAIYMDFIMDGVRDGEFQVTDVDAMVSQVRSVVGGMLLDGLLTDGGVTARNARARRCSEMLERMLKPGSPRY